MGEGEGESGGIRVCVSIKEREYGMGESVRVGGGRERVRRWGRESRWWEREWEREREGGNENVCKRDRVGDGRECESVRESR